MVQNGVNIVKNVKKLSNYCKEYAKKICRLKMLTEFDKIIKNKYIMLMYLQYTKMSSIIIPNFLTLNFSTLHQYSKRYSDEIILKLKKVVTSFEYIDS